MKKFLSLALALIMTLSLVTISAGATEYKDFTDKDEIQYEEAVAVLNRLGIITGYSEGDFRPEGELTRGAAAKIIVSLLIGPEAAEALPTTNSPYPDVPAGNVFAGYISFCKTEKIINGYNDGTFRPSGTLTGFAFAKMLLSALGYDGKVEGFTGSGWTVRVSALGSKANLFNRLDFKGGETVNRETACLLALNTLKATMVQYTGGMNITSSDGTTMVVNATREYVTSNQEYASHINNRKVSNSGNSTSDQHFTVEFGEEHFKDLRMETERSNKDDFGRPSNVWSYKKVTIGTYPVEPDFTYTTQVAHDIPETTDASKVRALGLNGFETVADTNSQLRGQTTNLTVNGLDKGSVAKVADIANYTDNGVLVEVYVSDLDADFIEDVVVIQTQLMEVKRVGSDYVSLDRSDVDDLAYGYNKKAIDVNVNDVEVDDSYYNTLKELKAGDLVAVIPVTTDGGASYDVAKAYVPETVTGKLTRVETFGTTGVERKAINVTVGGSKYNIAQWNRDLTGIDGDTIRVTNKDVTLYLDEYGNALKSKDVGDTSNWMVIKNYRQGLVNGSIVTYVNGWDIGGEELTLNVGGGSVAKKYEENYLPGDLVYYSNAVNSNTAEWKLSKGETTTAQKSDGVFAVNYEATMADTKPYSIKASNTTINLKDFGLVSTGSATSSNLATIDTGIKFIYVDIDTDGEVDSIEFVNGVKAATNEELRGKNSYYGEGTEHAIAQACVSLKTDADIVNADSAVKAVVIKRESTDASVSNLLYISNYHGSATLYDNDNRPVYGYEAVMMGANGKVADEKAIVYSYRNLKIGQFARYSKVAVPEGISGINDNFYELRGYGVDSVADTWKRSAAVTTATLTRCLTNDKYLVKTTGAYGVTGTNPEIATHHAVDQYILGDGDSEAANLLNFRGADWVDLRKNATRIEDIDDLKAILHHKTDAKDVQVSLLFNDNPDNDNFRHVYLVVVTGVTDKSEPPTPPTDKFDITVNVDGVKNEALSKTGLEDKATETIEYTVPEGKTATYTVDKGTASKTYSAGEKISIPVTINGKSVVIDITLAEAAGAGLSIRFADGFQKYGKELKLTNNAYVAAGTVYVDFSLKAPDWACGATGAAPTAAELTLGYDIMLNGVVLKRVAAAASSTTLTSGVYDLTTTDSATAPAGTMFKADDVIEVVITSIGWHSAKVEYVDGETGKPLAVKTSNAFMPTNSTGSDFRFTVDDARYQGTGTISVKGVSAVTGTTLTTTTAAAGSVTHLGTSAGTPAVYATGGEKVVITVNGLKAADDINYIFTNGGTHTIADTNLQATEVTFTSTMGAGVKGGTKANITATLDTAVAYADDPVKMTVTDKAGNSYEFIFKNNNTAVATCDDFVVGDDVDLTGATIAFEKVVVELPTIESAILYAKTTDATWTANDEIVITYNVGMSSSMTGGTAGGTGLAATTPGKVANNGDESATVVITAIPTAADGVITFAAGTLQSADGYFNQKTITIEVPNTTLPLTAGQALTVKVAA